MGLAVVCIADSIVWTYASQPAENEGPVEIARIDDSS